MEIYPHTPESEASRSRKRQQYIQQRPGGPVYNAQETGQHTQQTKVRRENTIGFWEQTGRLESSPRTPMCRLRPPPPWLRAAAAEPQGFRRQGETYTSVRVQAQNLGEGKAT